MAACDAFFDLAKCKTAKPTTVQELLPLLTPDAMKVVDCVEKLVAASYHLSQKGAAEGLVLNSEGLQRIVSMSTKEPDTTGASVTPDTAAKVSTLETCIKGELAKIAQAGGQPTEADFEKIIVDCVEPHCPGIKSMLGCIGCMGVAMEPFIQSNNQAGAVNAVLTKCTSCHGATPPHPTPAPPKPSNGGDSWWSKQPDWVRWLIIIGGALLVLSIIGGIAYNARKEEVKEKARSLFGGLYSGRE